MLTAIGIAFLVVALPAAGILIYLHNKARFDAVQAKVDAIHAAVTVPKP